MKTINLAGGFGTRFPEYTQKIAKRMIKIRKETTLNHIIRIFKSYG